MTLVKIEEKTKGKRMATRLQNYLKTKIVFLSIHCGWVECCGGMLTQWGKLRIEINYMPRVKLVLMPRPT